MQNTKYFAVAKQLLDEMVELGKNEISSGDIRKRCGSTNEENQIFDAIEVLCFYANTPWNVEGWKIHKKTGYRIAIFKVY